MYSFWKFGKVFNIYNCWKLTVLKEACTELYRNRLKLGADKTELVNVLFASAKGGKGGRSAYKVPLASMLNRKNQQKPT